MQVRMLSLIHIFKYDTSEQMARLFDLEDSGYFYTRLQNPTNAVSYTHLDVYKRQPLKADLMKNKSLFLVRVILCLTSVEIYSSRQELKFDAPLPSLSLIHILFHHTNVKTNGPDLTKILENLSSRCRAQSYCSQRTTNHPKHCLLYTSYLFLQADSYWDYISSIPLHE